MPPRAHADQGRRLQPRYVHLNWTDHCLEAYGQLPDHQEYTENCMIIVRIDPLFLEKGAMSGMTRNKIIEIALGACLLALVAAVVVCCCFRVRARRQQRDRNEVLDRRLE